MRSLFSKFLFWFWIALVVIIGSEVALESRSLREGLALVPGGGPETIGSRADQVRASLARGGMPALDQAVEALNREGLVDAYVVERNGTGHLGDAVPDGARRAGAAALRARGRMVVETPRGVFVGYPLSSYGGGDRALVLHPDRSGPGVEDSPTEWIRLLPYDLMVRALAMLLIGGFGAFLLARSITAPVARLKRATERLGAGDLTARVGPDRPRGRDELVDLGRDFDRMAERIETLVGAQRRLLGDVSHELRSPLARLGLALGVLRQRGVEDPMIERIETEAGRLNDLIEDVLTLTRLESGDHGEKLERVDLAALAAGVVDDARFEAGTRGCSVRMAPHAPLPVQGHPVLLRSALENVVRNAIRHTAEGTSVDVVLATEELPDGSRAAIRVRDHGPGLPTGQLERIFEPFYRVDDARTRDRGGSGLGLAIARRAVARHGGSIVAELAPEGGLLVTIRLPVAETSEG